MKNVLIVENTTNPLKVNESASDNSRNFLNGIFTEFSECGRIKEKNVGVQNKSLFQQYLHGIHRLNPSVTFIHHI